MFYILMLPLRNLTDFHASRGPIKAPGLCTVYWSYSDTTDRHQQYYQHYYQNCYQKPHCNSISVLGQYWLSWL